MKYITYVRKSFQGAWIISGTIGTKQYMFYSKRNAIKLYNYEAKLFESEQKQKNANGTCR